MYKTIQSPRKIAAIQKQFLIEINECLPRLDGDFIIGHQGNNFTLDNLRSNGIIWFGHFKYQDAPVPRFWNGFGLSSQLTLSGSNKIITETNVALDGNHRGAKSVAAFFAEDENGRIALLHTGKVGGGKKGVGKFEFLSWYEGEKEHFLQPGDSNTVESAILVSEIGNGRMSKQICSFVESVAQFKSGYGQSDTADISTEELKQKAKLAKRKARVSTSITTVYSRNKYVAEYAKRRANGRCNLCTTDAPFVDEGGRP